MASKSWHTVYGAGILCILSGCTSYRAVPLVPEDVVSQVDSLRAHPDTEQVAPVEPISFVKASQWMLARGPGIREAIANYRTTLARASRKTPLPNPGLEVGPQFGFGPDQGTVNPWSPFGSIGFSIPLGKRLRRQDELNRALAEVARIDALVRHREAYLQLRSHYSEYFLGRLRGTVLKEIVTKAGEAADSTQKLVNAGQATALDVALFKLDLSQSLVAELEANQWTAQAQSAMALEVGVQRKLFENVPDGALPHLPEQMPEWEGLRELMVANHAELARLRVRYESSERELRLEIAKQWPDFQFGPSFDSESGERRTVLGLTLGLELPVFDRNEQAIGEADKRREETRIQYEAAASRALAILDASFAKLDLARKKATMLRNELVPQSEESLKLAKRAMEAGAGDVLKVLDAERSYRRARVQLLDSEIEERMSWVELERAVGRPLMRFPDENIEIVVPSELVDVSGVKFEEKVEGEAKTGEHNE